MPKKIKTFIVDSFTNKPFKGNPAGVCLLEEDLNDSSMLSIANELGFSETAFINKSEKNNTYNIRYFTPEVEIPLCGHATLASAKIVFDKNKELEKIHFITSQNLDLYIQKSNELITMEFPVYKTVPATIDKKTLQFLGLDKIVNCELNPDTNILLLEIEDCNLLESLQPNISLLKPHLTDKYGITVTTKSNKENIDYECRCFAPWVGIDEDPATGGIQTFLINYWNKRLKKTKMNCFQSSKRTGFMELELLDNDKFTMKSNAQIILEGNIFI